MTEQSINTLNRRDIVKKGLQLGVVAASTVLALGQREAGAWPSHYDLFRKNHTDLASAGCEAVQIPVDQQVSGDGTGMVEVLGSAYCENPSDLATTIFEVTK